MRDVQPGEELTVWYSNSLAQWFDIPTTATPTHDEKGTASEKVAPTLRVSRVESTCSPGLGKVITDLKNSVQLCGNRVHALDKGERELLT